MPTQDDIKKELAGRTTAIKERSAGGDGGPPTIRKLLEDPKMQGEIAKAIPTAMTPQRFTRLMLTAVNSNPMLLECEAKSLLAAGMQCAQLGLEPNTALQHCWLLPFRDNSKGIIEVQFVLGYRGIIDLVLRSGRATVEARVVYDNDPEFDYEYGLADKLVHKPTLDKPGEILTFYSIARYKDFGHHWRLITKGEIDEHRQQSKAPNSPAWKNHYLPMALKTCIRIMSPMLPLSPEAAAGIAADDQVMNFDDMVAGGSGLIDTTGEEAAAAEPGVVCDTCGGENGAHEAGCPEAAAK